MRFSQKDVDEIKQLIDYFLRLRWKDLSKNEQEYHEVASNILVRSLEAINKNLKYNILTLLRDEQRKYQRYLNRFKAMVASESDSSEESSTDSEQLYSSFEEIASQVLPSLRQLWEVVPSLRLSIKQTSIYVEYLNYIERMGSRWGFESYYSKHTHISQPAISKDLSRALEIVNLSRLLLPETLSVNRLISVFGSDWSSSPLRHRIWPLLKPGKNRVLALAKLLKPFQNELFDFSALALTSFSRQASPSPKLFYQGYNALILGTYIDPDNVGSASFELAKDVAPKSWLAGRAVARQSHLIHDIERWGEYRDWLLDLYFKETMAKEKERYISYMVSYFGGYRDDEADGYVLSKANYIPEKYDVEKLIREHYQNISDTLYTRSPTLMEINFLRIALILSTIKQFDFSPSIISCVSQIFKRTASVSEHPKVNLIIFEFEQRMKSVEGHK